MTKAHIHVAGFEPIIRLLPKRLTSAILVQCLAEGWWDITHTFYIAKREMIVTPQDFHHRIGLRCDSATINLEGKSSSWLAIDLLKRRYSSNSIRYFNIKVDYQPLPQEMAVDCAQMARAFLHYILGAYLFANGGHSYHPHLPWMVYAYGLDEFARERLVPHNINIIGYPFPNGTQAISPLPSLSSLFLLLLHLSTAHSNLFPSNFSTISRSTRNWFGLLGTLS